MDDNGMTPRCLVAIDPGHGGSDPGAVGPSGLQEKDVTLPVALRLRDALVTAGCDTVLTRDGDRDVSCAGSPAGVELQARVDVANSAGADVFVALHCNGAAAEAHGTEVWYYHEGQTLAEELCARLGALGLTVRGAKQGGFYVLKYTVMPAVLIEMAFITNPQEEARLGDPAFQGRLAAAICQGLLTSLNQ